MNKQNTDKFLFKILNCISYFKRKAFHLLFVYCTNLNPAVVTLSSGFQHVGLAQTYAPLYACRCSLDD